MVVSSRPKDLLRPMMVGSLIQADHPVPKHSITLRRRGDIAGGGTVGNQFEKRPVFGS